MRRTAPLLALWAASLCAGCDPHKLKVTDQNRAGLVDSLRENSRLSAEEKGLLAAFVARAPGEAPGRTVGELIAAQRAFAQQEGARLEAERKRVADANEKAARDRWQMQSTLGWTVSDKRIQPKDEKAGRAADLLVIECQYDNRSGKDVAAFQGRLRFRDAYGQELFVAEVKADKALPVGGKATWTVERPLDPAGDAALRGITPRGIAIDFTPRSIRLADGTVLGEK